jgi:hypothetical protein
MGDKRSPFLCRFQNVNLQHLNDKMHPSKVIARDGFLNNFKFLRFQFLNFLGAFYHLGKFTFFKSA